MMPKATPKKCLRIVGDVHGYLDRYLNIAKKAKYSLCVGDVGFDYSYLTRHLDPQYGRLIGGNHDNYSKKPCEECNGPDCKICEGRGFVFTCQSKHFLGDFGQWEVPDFGKLFYVRGAWSIDKDFRIPGVSWWEDEEISIAQGCKALDLYSKLKPNFVVTHTVPMWVVPQIPFKRIFGDVIHQPRTEQMLQSMWDVHQPKTWVFGHWHINWWKWMTHPKTGNKTRFICLNELSYADFTNSDFEDLTIFDHWEREVKFLDTE